MREVFQDFTEGCAPPDYACIRERRQDVPSPGPGQLLARVAGSAIEHHESTDPVNVTMPLGFEFSGVVQVVGPACPGFQAGDHIWTAANIGFADITEGVPKEEFSSGGFSGFGEYALCVCRWTGPAPRAADLAQAGTMPANGITALGALESAGIPRGSTVLITAGTGGVGYPAVQIAKALGASKVVTAAGHASGVAFVKALGADIAVDYHTESILDAVADGSVDVVFDSLAGWKDMEPLAAKLRPGGVLVTVSGSVVFTWDPAAMSFQKFADEGYKIWGARHPPPGVRQYWYNDWSPAETARKREKMDTLAALIDSGKVRVFVNRTYDFDHVKDAYRQFEGHGILSRIGVVPSFAAFASLGPGYAVLTE